MGAKEWFAAGVVIVAILTGIIGFATPREDNRVITNSYNNNVNALVNVNNGSMNTTETNNVDNSQANTTQSTTTNDVTSAGSSQVKIDEWGGKWCWDEPSNQWIRACPQP